MNEIVDLILTRIDSVATPANEHAEVKLAKAERVPDPPPVRGTNGPNYVPVPPPIALVELRALARERGRLLAEGNLGTELERQRRRARLVQIDELLREGNGADAMREQAAGQRRSFGVDEGVTHWNGRSISENADGSKTKVITTAKSEPVTKASMGALLRRRRGELGLTQEALSKTTGVSERSVRDYEAGAAVATASNACRIAKALGLSIGEQNAWASLNRRER